MFQNNLLMAGASTGAGALTVDNSVRYNDDDSPRLYRTPSIAGNRRIGSLSFWYKRCNLGSIQQLFNAGAGDDITFNASDKLTFIDSSGVSYITTQVFRDLTAWGHLLFAWDTTLATAGDRLRIYHNGIEITEFDTETNPSQFDEFEISNTVRQTIGANESDTEEFDGYFSQFYYIDGNQHTPTSFGEFDDNGVWRPIEYTASSTAATITFLQDTIDMGNASTYTFAGQALGAAAADRIIVCFAIDGVGSTATAVTIGGVAATLVQTATTVRKNTLWYAAVPSGTTGDVVVTGAAETEMGIALWRLTGVGGPCASGQSGANPGTATLSVPAGGVAIGGMGDGHTTYSGYTWTGLTEDFDVELTVSISYTGASATNTSAQSLTISCAAHAFSNSGFQAVAFGPSDASYGINGFFLDFADSGLLGKDANGSGTLALTYVGENSTTTNAAAHTFSSESIGTAAADRYVIVGATYVGGSTPSPATVTIGGINAVELILQAPASFYAHTSFFYALVPTGTTADIVVTWANSSSNFGIGVWNVTGSASVSPVQVAGDNTSPASAVTLNIPSGAAAMGLTINRGASATCAWVGLTENFDTQIESINHFSGSSSTTAGSATSVTATWSTTASAALSTIVLSPGNNFLSSGLAAADQMDDTSTKNFCTLLPIRDKGSITYSDGNLEAVGAVASQSVAAGSISVSSGKFIYASQPATLTTNVGEPYLANESYFEAGMPDLNTASNVWGIKLNNSTTWFVEKEGTNVTITHGFSGGWETGVDFLVICFDVDNLKIWCGGYDVSAGVLAFADGSTGVTGDPGAGTDPTATISGTGFTGVFDFWSGRAAGIDFGQSDLLSQITIPTGFKFLNTANLSAPTLKNPDVNFVNINADAANVVSDLSTAQSDAGWGSDGTVDIYKNREITENWKVRFSDDASNELVLNTNAAKVSNTAFTSGDSYQGFSLRMNSTKGCATGTISHTNGSDTSAAHGISLPTNKAVIMKREDSTGDWIMGAHPALTANNNIVLNTNSSETSTESIAVDASNVIVKSAVATGTYRYLVIPAWDDVVSMGQYTGNGAADGPFAYTGQLGTVTMIDGIRTSTASEGVWFFNPSNTSNPTDAFFDTPDGSAERTGFGLLIDTYAAGIMPRGTHGSVNQSTRIMGYIQWGTPFGGDGVTPATAF